MLRKVSDKPILFMIDPTKRSVVKVKKILVWFLCTTFIVISLQFVSLPLVDAAEVSAGRNLIVFTDSIKRQNDGTIFVKVKSGSAPPMFWEYGNFDNQWWIRDVGIGRWELVTNGPTNDVLYVVLQYLNE